MGNVQGVVQYNDPSDQEMSITIMCQAMLAGPDPYTQFVNFSNTLLLEGTHYYYYYYYYYLQIII